MTEITGRAAKLAARQFRWVWVAAAIEAAVLAIAWLVFHDSYEQVTFLGLGMGAWVIAGLVLRHGAIGFSFSTFGGKTKLSIRPSPIPRTVLAPILALAGAWLVIASTPTRLGAFMASPARLSLAVFKAGQAVLYIFPTVAVTAAAVWALTSRKYRLYGIAWLALLALVNGGAYLLAPAWFRAAWSSYLQPYIDLVNLLRGK